MLVDHISDIGHALKETDSKAGYRKFLTSVHCPITILEIIMLGGGKSLDRTVSAVVVCDKQAFIRDDFSGTAPTELYNCVFDGRMIDTVNLVCREAAAQIRHCLFIHFLKEGQKPHSFICFCASGQKDQSGQCEKYFFHTYL